MESRQVAGLHSTFFFDPSSRKSAPLLPRLLSDVGLPSRPHAGWMPPVLGIQDSTLPKAKERLPLKSLRPPYPCLIMVGSSLKSRAVARSCMASRAVIQRLAIDMLGERLIGISDLTLPKVKKRLPLESSRPPLPLVTYTPPPPKYRSILRSCMASRAVMMPASD